jgi:hypothetical protein
LRSDLDAQFTENGEGRHGSQMEHFGVVSQIIYYLICVICVMIKKWIVNRKSVIVIRKCVRPDGGKWNKNGSRAQFETKTGVKVAG